MDGRIDEGSDSFYWDTEDELEIQNRSRSSCSSVANPTQEGASGARMRYMGPSTSKSKLFHHFVGMGFSELMVTKAIEENGEDDTEAVLETLLTYSALEKSCSPCSSESKEGISDDELSDTDSFLNNEQTTGTLSEKEKNLLFLVEMGFQTEEASSAMDRCGPDASLVELTDSIYAAQVEKTFDSYSGDAISLSSEEDEKNESCWYDDEFPRVAKRRRWSEEGSWKQSSQSRSDVLSSFSIPNPMIGFGVPTEPSHRVYRKLPEAALGPPYFYFENVAIAPKGSWETISRFLYDIEPEFVDSRYFCAASRKRGYIHNLPIQNRFPLQPLPPRTIHEALPLTRKWWPSWDHRTQLNCIRTRFGTGKLTERISKVLANADNPPSLEVQKHVLQECRKWNLVWVGRHKVAPLEPDEIETLLGFPRDHTRGGGFSRQERLRSLGNTFQVDTVAYHLSVLKEIFPNGITLLSLFSGIGGAEVALHGLGIPLKTVVSVEISEINRNVIRCWWEQTNQKGTLIFIEDVQQLDGERLEKLITTFGGFDLVIGGSPCNNLSGSNRVTRDGLEGKDSALFYDYFRILDLVKCIMGQRA